MLLFYDGIVFLQNRMNMIFKIRSGCGVVLFAILLEKLSIFTAKAAAYGTHIFQIPFLIGSLALFTDLADSGFLCIFFQRYQLLYKKVPIISISHLMHC